MVEFTPRVPVHYAPVTFLEKVQFRGTLSLIHTQNVNKVYYNFIYNVLSSVVTKNRKTTCFSGRKTGGGSTYP